MIELLRRVFAFVAMMVMRAMRSGETDERSDDAVDRPREYAPQEPVVSPPPEISERAVVTPEPRITEMQTTPPPTDETPAVEVPEAEERASEPAPPPVEETPLEELQRTIAELQRQVDELRSSQPDAAQLEAHLRELDELAGRAAALIAAQENPGSVGP